MTTDLRREVEWLLEAARERFHAWLTAGGRSPLGQKWIVSVHNRGSGGWDSRSRTEPVSNVDYLLGEWVGGLDGDWAASAIRVARDIAASNEVRLPFWAVSWSEMPSRLTGLSPFHGTFDDDGARWIVDRVLLPAATAYLRRLSNTMTADAALRAHIATEVIEFLEADTLTVETRVGVAGLRTDQDDIAVGELAVHRLSPDERGEILQELQVPQVGGSGIGLRLIQNDLPTHVIVVRDMHPRLPQPEFDFGTRMWSALGAFYMNGYDLSGPGHVITEMLPKFGQFGRSGGPFRLRLETRSIRELSNAELTEIDADFRRLRSKWVEYPRSSGELAVHRFITGCSRDDDVDSLLDFVICLEAILLPSDPEARRGDLSYRFRVHGAHLLGDPADRRPTWRALRGLYETRSRLVHGAKYPDRREIRAQADVARDLAARACRHAVRNGFPTADDFNSAVLGV